MAKFIERLLCRTSIIFMIVVFFFVGTNGVAYDIEMSDEMLDDISSEIPREVQQLVYIPAPPMSEPAPNVPEMAPDIPTQNTSTQKDEVAALIYVQVLQEIIPLARCYFKSWMDWRAITYRNSRQWRMQQVAYTCDDGFRRVDGLYMIALGTYFLYHGVGDVFDVALSSGVTFRAVVGDVKDDRHTDPTNRFHRSDGSVVEFIVDRQVMCSSVLSTGSIASAGFPGDVVSMKRLPELFISV